ncbi:Septum formation inhibitor MinC [Gloeothece citriformis PCC 7424]|uniref:Probable septum site-determining protein MinC n=1 Tax=Gloeothece citriformis (strain PCC 7424) TaxID=65393 RepID=B7KA66_GLOC7|nr:septum site-determining protein MinC [Gloeothece citriformis]ACK71422.1 Septum formation inhibitor MinC [Gloeothece citriformis PCC 7424]
MDSPSPTTNQNQPSSPSLTERYSQVHLKSEGKKLSIILPKPTQQDPVNDWMELEGGLKHCLKRSDPTWPPDTLVHLVVEDRLLDTRQLQLIAKILEDSQLHLKTIYTSRRQTAVAAATSGYSVEQQPLTQPFSSQSNQQQSPLADPLYLKMTVRSGVEVRHPGTVIIQGDVNPGGAIIADGDILVWGWLRGVAHAGALGNQECTIMTLRMEPTQLRIADVVARAPSTTPAQIEPEVAFITPEGIRITQAYNFSKTHSFIPEIGGWKMNN